jgi:hypothetical protein
MASALERTIADAKAARAANYAAFGAVTDAALDSATTLAPVLQPVAERAIARLTAAVRALRPAGPESQAHVDWRLKAGPINVAIARAQANQNQPGGSDVINALYRALPKEPPFDDGGAATQAEQAIALGAVRLLLNV